VFEEHAPPRQPGELRWSVFGIHYRVLPSFWLVSALIAYVIFGAFGQRPPVQALVAIVALDVACIFAALVFTTLMQGLVYRSYGLYSTVVIQEFSGGVIPEAEPASRLQRIMVALSAPISCFALFAVVYYTNEAYQWRDAYGLYTFFPYYILFYTGLFWGIIGLLPIYPYSGGRVMLEVFSIASPLKGLIATLLVSIVVGIAYIAYVIAVETGTMKRIMLYDNLPLPAGIIIAIFFGISTVRNVQLLNIVRAQTRRYRPDEDTDDAPWERR